MYIVPHMHTHTVHLPHSLCVCVLKNVMIGEEYEVRVSSVELSTGKVSPLSRAVTVGEKRQ